MPSTHLPPRPELAPLSLVLRRLRARLATQRGLARGLTGIGLTGLSVAAALGASVSGWLSPDAPIWVLSAGLVASAGLALSGLRALPDALTLAARLDAAAGLPSELGNAVAFAAEATADSPRGELLALTVARGVEAARSVDWRLASPWRLRPLRTGIALVLLASIALPVTIAAPRAVVSPVRGAVLAGLPRLAPRDDGDGVALLEADARRLAEDKSLQLQPSGEGASADAGALSDQLARVETLVSRVLSGALSHEEAMAELGALDAALGDWQASSGGPWQAVARQIAEAAAKQAAESEEGKGAADAALGAVLDAMARRDWEAAAKLMEQAAALGGAGLADKLAELVPEAQAKQAAAALRDFADELKTEAMREEAAMAEEASRLKRKQAEARLTPKEAQRLAALEQELATRQREKLKVPESMRHLAELARQFEGLARELMERYELEGEGGVGPSEEARRSTQQQGQAQQGQGQQGQAQQGQGQQGQGQQGQAQHGQGQQGQAQHGQGQQGQAQQGQGQGGAGRDPLSRALGEAQAAVSRLGAAEREGQAAATARRKLDTLRDMLDRSAAAQREATRGGQGDGPRDADGPGAPGGARPDDGKRGRPGAGAGSGPRPGGDAGGEGGEASGRPPGVAGTRPDDAPDEPGAPKQRPEGGGGQGAGPARAEGPEPAPRGDGPVDFLPGREGPGQSRTRLLEAAAERGVRSPAVDAMLGDYRAVAEDELRSERVPPGKRGYVRRYFDAIQPR